MLGDSRADAPLVLLTCSLPVPPRFAWPMPIPTTVERTVTQASRFKRGPRSADFGQRGVPVGRVQASVRATQRTGVAQPPDEHKSLLEHDLQTTPHWARTSNLRFRRPMLYPIELGVRTCHAANRQDARARPNKAAIAAMHESNHITDRRARKGLAKRFLHTRHAPRTAGRSWAARAGNCDSSQREVVLRCRRPTAWFLGRRSPKPGCGTRGPMAKPGERVSAAPECCAG